MSTPAPYRLTARNLVPDADNKIHDDDVARRFGFAGALVPGVELFAYATHPLVAAWGPDFLRRGGLDLQFRSAVYDGEQVVATATADGDGWAVTLSGPDGDARAVGRGWPQAPADSDGPAPAVAALPPSLLPVDGPLPLGPFGSVSEPVDEAGHESYLDGIDETLPLYRADRVVHPGALLRLVNAVLMRNVDLGPWIHTGSRCRFLDLATWPTTLHAHAVVTDCFERKGNAWVRYDALVLAGDRPVARVDHTAIYRLGSAAAP